MPYAASVEDAIEKLQYDLYYVKNLSLWLDLLILAETVKTVVRQRGAPLMCAIAGIFNYGSSRDRRSRHRLPDARHDDASRDRRCRACTRAPTDASCSRIAGSASST